MGKFPLLLEHDSSLCSDPKAIVMATCGSTAA